MRRLTPVLAAMAALAIAGPSPVPAQMGGQVGGAPMGGRPGSGPPAGETGFEAGPDKPDAASKKAFNAGGKALTKARGYDDAAAKAPNADKKAKELEKADDAYSRALDEFTEALSNKGDLFDAWNYAGSIHLRLGAFAESLDDYNHALNLKPDFMPAVEGRAEASLALNRLEEVRVAYMDLYSHAPDLAGKLMQAMQQWLTSHRQDGAVRPSDLDAMDKWLQERAVVAKAAP